MHLKGGWLLWQKHKLKKHPEKKNKNLPGYQLGNAQISVAACPHVFSTCWSNNLVEPTTHLSSHGTYWDRTAVFCLPFNLQHLVALSSEHMFTLWYFLASCKWRSVANFVTSLFNLWLERLNNAGKTCKLISHHHWTRSCQRMSHRPCGARTENIPTTVSAWQKLFQCWSNDPYSDL